MIFCVIIIISKINHHPKSLKRDGARRRRAVAAGADGGRRRAGRGHERVDRARREARVEVHVVAVDEGLLELRLQG